MTIGRNEQQNRRVFAVIILIVVIFCLPLSYFVLSTPPPKNFFLWLNDDDIISKIDDDSSFNGKKAAPDFGSEEKTTNKGEAPPLLLLISYDAFRYDYIEKHPNVTPTFRWLIENGVYATEGLKNTFITITAPNHYGIVTGLYEESHGIIANSFFDPILNESFNYFDTRWKTDPRFFGGDPIWTTNDESSPDRATGCVMWVGCDVAINRKRKPLHWVSWDGNLDWAARVDALISWFKNPRRPINFGLLYIEEPDETGHQYGPDSPELAQMLWKLDQLTAYLLWRLHTSGLLDKINIIFTADHGMASVPILNVVNMDDYLNRSMYTVYGGTPNWNVKPAEGKEEEVYETLKNRVPHLNVYNKSDIPADFRYKNNQRIMDLQLVADLHWWLTYNFSSLTSQEGTNRSQNRPDLIRGLRKFENSTSKNYTTGEHGYNNSLPEMHPYFIGYGPAFKKSFNITQFMNIDLYVLMCYILNIQPSPNNGSFERVRSILADEGSKWPSSKMSETYSFATTSAKFRTFFDRFLRNGSKSGFIVEYEFRSINFKTNVHYDVLIMFLLLFAYLIYMAVLVRSIKPPPSTTPNAKKLNGHEKLVEKDAGAFYSKNI